MRNPTFASHSANNLQLGFAGARSSVSASLLTHWLGGTLSKLASSRCRIQSRIDAQEVEVSVFTTWKTCSCKGPSCNAISSTAFAAISTGSHESSYPPPPPQKNQCTAKQYYGQHTQTGITYLLELRETSNNIHTRKHQRPRLRLVPHPAHRICTQLADPHHNRPPPRQPLADLLRDPFRARISKWRGSVRVVCELLRNTRGGLRVPEDCRGR